MNKRNSLVVGAIVVAVLTQGFVYGGCHFDRIQPTTTYIGLFQHTILVIEAVWSKAHRWDPLSHVDHFGRWFAEAVHCGCPTLGFAVFCLISGRRVGRDVWKPLGIVAAFTAAAGLIGSVSSLLDVVWTETVSTVFVFGLMVWSIGALPAIRLSSLLARRIELAQS
jgi:hypothetical protein